MTRAHRIRLDPTNKQRTYFAKAAGTARFAYNWALAEWTRQQGEGQNPGAYSLSRQLTAVKDEQFGWMRDVSCSAPERAILQLGEAFKNFYAKRAKQPTFRRKGEHERFTLQQRGFRVRDRMLWVGKLGYVRMTEPLRFTGRLISATVSLSGGEWYVSISVEVADQPTVVHQGGTVGVDLGVRNLATLSNGEVVTGPKPHKALLGRLRRIRQDAIHKLTTDLTRRFSVIGIEDLNVDGMKRGTLARSISDMGFYEFRRQLEYKAAAVGARVVVADRFFPSSKTCSSCGVISELDRRVTSWRCVCGVEHNRDVNAARNLEKVAAGSAVSACGAVEVHGTEAGTSQSKAGMGAGGQFSPRKPRGDNTLARSSTERGERE